MAKKQQQRKLELLGQIANTRLDAGHPKELLLRQVNLEGKLKGKVQSLALNLRERVQTGVKEDPKKAAIMAGAGALFLTLILKGKGSRRKLVRGQKGETVIKYLPERKKRRVSRTVLKFAWALALPSIKNWARKKATRAVTEQVKAQAVKRLTGHRN